MQATQPQVTRQAEYGALPGASAKSAIGVAGAMAALIGTFMLTAWLNGAAARWSAAGGNIIMKTNMAMGLVLAGAALVLLGLCPQRPVCRWAGLAAATVILLLGILTLSEHLIGCDLGIDQLLATEPPGAIATSSPNRIGPPGATSTAVLGMALALLGTGRRRAVPYLGLIVILANLVPAIGFLYDVDEFYIRSQTAIAWPTVLAMIGLGLGLVLACTESGPMTLLLRDDAGGQLLRGMLPAVLLLPLALGFLRMLGQSRGMYDTAMGAGLFALAMMLVFSLMLWRSAGQLSRADRQRKQGEDALRQSREDLTGAQAVGQIGSWRLDVGLNILGWSDETYHLFGVPPGTPMTYERFLEVVHPDDRQYVDNQWQAALRGEPYDIEHRIVVNAQVQWMREKAYLEFDRSGNLLGGFGIVQDITQRKQAEEQLKAAKLSAEQAKDAAEAASRAKDHFLAVLSHELRTPLNPVVATVAMLQRDPRLDADTCEQLEVIRRNVEMEARLIDDLLDVTRIERGKVELDRRVIDLCTIIRRAAEVCASDIEARDLQFSMDLGPAPYWVDADAARLQQVFWNLIKNAVKFTHMGGSVGIICRRDHQGFVAVEVSDSGEGIEPELLPRLFNAFEQGGRPTTRQFGGLGLGLTISKAMVEMHGGCIYAQSTGKGKGATFTVCLPLLPADAAMPAVPVPSPSPASAVPAAPAGTATRPLRILLVEDHGDTARIMRRVLMATGHEVQMAADVATALKLIGGTTFDLLLSDLGLPDGSGLDLMREIRRAGLKLPGIALSGFGQEQDLQQSREVGFAAHLVKPVSMQRLEEAIAEIARSEP